MHGRKALLRIVLLNRQQHVVPVHLQQLPALGSHDLLGAERIELNTESYARAHGTPAQAARLAAYAAAADAALAAGLQLNAGHDLNRANLGDFLRAVPGVQEVSIGHALIGDAIEFGISETVRLYQRCIRDARAGAAGA